MAVIEYSCAVFSSSHVKLTIILLLENAGGGGRARIANMSSDVVDSNPDR